MTRLLCVDDEPLVLDMIQSAVATLLPDWEVAVAADARQAFAALDGAPFDIVISDMRMPRIDGAQVLRRVRETQPGSFRVIMSGDSGGEAALRASTLAHQYLLKPIGLAELVAVLSRVETARRWLRDPALLNLVGGIHALPSVPTLYAELTARLTDPRCSVSDIAGIVGRDIAMSLKILQLARSAFFGLGSDRLNLEVAVIRLGVGVIQGLALTVGVFEAFRRVVPGSFSIEDEQVHAVAVAQAACRLELPGLGIEEAFLAGLMHDVGKLVLAARRPESAQRLRAQAASERRPLAEVEAVELGATHAEIGAYLLALWGMPHPIVEAVLHHHAPSRLPAAGAPLVTAVHLADGLVRRAEDQASGIDGVRRLDEAYLRSVGVWDKLFEWEATMNGEWGGPPSGWRSVPC
jgi:HD-like signal output (HDOD) protein